jgi:hypothetical protein
MNPKIEEQLLKVKKLDGQMISKLGEWRAAKEAALNAREKETDIFNQINMVEKDLEAAKEELFVVIRNDKGECYDSC